jgi:2-polyprenyl-6-methoxyphenol hydroxylase-like FAD-dependent oxidoreductase
MTTSPVLIAGAGIGGLSVALTLHQIGVPCVVFESVPEIKPLGLGINIQPNAVRELYELGFGPELLDAIGLQTREWALVGLNGNEVYSELRGLRAGYGWRSILCIGANCRYFSIRSFWNVWEPMPFARD